MTIKPLLIAAVLLIPLATPRHKPEVDVVHVRQFGAYDCWSINDGPEKCADNPIGYTINKAVAIEELE